MKIITCNVHLVHARVRRLVALPARPGPGPPTGDQTGSAGSAGEVAPAGYDGVVHGQAGRYALAPYRRSIADEARPFSC